MSGQLHDSPKLAATMVATAVAALALCFAGCGGGNTAPSSPVTAADLIGTWTDGTRTWTISAGSAGFGQSTVVQFGGPATFVHANHPAFGSMSARGGVTGTMVVGLTKFMLAESYDVVSSSLFATPSSCYIDADGQLTLSGNTLTGTVTERDSCSGTRLRDTSYNVTLQRR